MNKLWTIVYVGGIAFFTFNALHKGVSGYNLGFIAFGVYLLFKEVKSWGDENKEKKTEPDISDELPLPKGSSTTNEANKEE